MEVNAGASNGEIVFSSKSDAQVKLNVGASNFQVFFPETVGYNIVFEGTSPTFKLDETLIKTKNGYKTVNYDNAGVKIDVTAVLSAGNIQTGSYDE